jgi:uncharacterized delta-60 repeat protein
MPTNQAPTFTTSNGLAQTPVGDSADFGQSVTVDASGRILVAGFSLVGSAYVFSVVRYNIDGTLDTSFDVDGKVLAPVGYSSRAFSVLVQADGKIVLAGDTFSGNRDFAVVRLNENGALDSSFGSGGIVSTPTGGFAEATSALLQPDGKILVVGTLPLGSAQYDLSIVRYNTNGTLDTSFDTDGRVGLSVSPRNDVANAVTLQSDGKIVVAGWGWSSLSDPQDFVVARFNVNGSVDTTFGGSGTGWVKTSFGTSDEAHAVAVQTDGKIVVAGNVYNSATGGFDFALVRYNSNGTLDGEFDGDGKLTTGFGGAYNNVYSMVLQPDGKILVGGSVANDPRGFAMARFNQDGSLDLSFGTNGTVVSDFGTYGGGAAITLQSDGKILLAGNAGDDPGNGDFALVRYNANGTLDTAFAPHSSLDRPVVFIEDGSPVVLASGVQISDSELDALNDYDGASVTGRRRQLG